MGIDMLVFFHQALAEAMLLADLDQDTVSFPRLIVNLFAFNWIMI